MRPTQKEPCPVCGRYDNRGISIDAVIIRHHQVLLIKRGAEPYKGYWALPGGFVEWDETTEEAVAREVQEETGLMMDACRLIGVYSSPGRHPEQVINIAYAATASGEPKAGDDALECKWFATGELPGDLAFDHKKIITDALKE